MIPASEPRCGNCIHWDRGAPMIATAERDPSQSPNVGACRYGGPQLMRFTLGIASYFPTTHETARCPDFDRGDEPDDPAREDIPEPRASVISLETRRAA